jgi:pimeloyl-ACP methyl ester carboxylesterase
VTETTLTPVDSRVQVAPGIALHVRAWAAGSAGAVFVLVHGLASNARLWDGVGERLAAAGHPAYAVDLRGHGESDRPEQGYDTRTAAADLVALADSLGLARPVFAGQSWGGNVVLELAARWPDRLAGLALVDGGWLHLADTFPTFEECWAALAPPRLPPVPVATVRERLRGFHPDWPPAAIEGTLGNFEELPDGTARIWLTRERHASILRSLWAHRPRELYPLVTVPTLLLPAGHLDADGDRRGAERVAEALAALPRASVRWYDGADHDLHAQFPERVAADLAELARPGDPPP